MKSGSRASIVAVAWVAALQLLVLPASVRCDSARNVVLFIGDGMGFEQVKAGRFFKGTNLVFEIWDDAAEMMTHSSNSAVTDSAASGTAMATGRKVRNGVLSIAIPGDGGELETLLEYFKGKGKRTGLVTTTYMTDATPGAFGAHETNRYNRVSVAADYLAQTRPNVLFGGGGNGMTLERAVAEGYTVVTNADELAVLDTAAETMVSGQFGRGHLPYEYDGLGDLPHLSDMTRTALSLLQHSTNGFFLMVEGGRIDHACHDNDIVYCVRETVEFDNAVDAALSWAAKRDDTLMIVTADHECGGLRVLADNEAGIEPDVSWTTTGHTGTNVGVWAWGPRSQQVSGVLDNTDIHGIVVRAYLLASSARSVGEEDGAVSSGWDARRGDVFRLERAPCLTNDSWTALVTITAQMDRITLKDTNPPAVGPAFYRLMSVR
ncbi:alkaline phosphatase [Verrucomicrobiota bacterium]